MTLENAVVLFYKPHSKMAVWFAKESFIPNISCKEY